MEKVNQVINIDPIIIDGEIWESIMKHKDDYAGELNRFVQSVAMGHINATMSGFTDDALKNLEEKSNKLLETINKLK